MKITPDMLAPEMAAFAAFLDKPTESEEAFRAGMAIGTQNAWDNYQKPEELDIQEMALPSREAGRTIRTLVIRRADSGPEPVPGILWTHGGAFASGIPEGSMVVFRRMLAAAPAVIVSPDYRLSTEHPYPAGLEDCYDALLWMRDHTEELGIRPDQLAIGGDSSGANFAVALALTARDTGDMNLAFQIPLYPCLDDTLQSESMKDNNAPLVDSSLCRIMWQVYLGEAFGTDSVPAYAAPIHETDFHNLPPMFGYVGGIDPLRDDGLFYARKLQEAGVPADFRVYPGGFHGFEEFCPDAAISKEAKEFFTEAFRKAVATWFAPQKG